MEFYVHERSTHIHGQTYTGVPKKWPNLSLPELTDTQDNFNHLGYLCAKNYQIWWRFDEVLTKTSWVIFWHTLYNLQSTSLHIICEIHLLWLLDAEQCLESTADPLHALSCDIHCKKRLYCIITQHADFLSQCVQNCDSNAKWYSTCQSMVYTVFYKKGLIFVFFIIHLNDAVSYTHLTLPTNREV